MFFKKQKRLKERRLYLIQQIRKGLEHLQLDMVQIIILNSFLSRLAQLDE